MPLSSGGRLSVVSSDILLCSSCRGFQEEAAAFLFLFFVPGGGHAGGARLSCWSVSGGNSIIMMCDGAGELCREVDS